jgi:hypothetical protein
LTGNTHLFLFPQRIPSPEDPEPPIHTLSTLRLPGLVLDLFDVQASEQQKHLWEVHIKVVEIPEGRLKRIIEVWHQGGVVDESISRSWRQ